TTRQQSGGDHHQAEQIGKIVANVAVRLPFRALCLQQVIAVRRMLARRDFASMIFLGVREENISEAHAWLTVGETVVSGGENLSAFRVLSAFR
ncbi:MAG: lasso peptide biosynthesis B2 protein, partial [Pseudomonadota bacterium]